MPLKTPQLKKLLAVLRRDQSALVTRQGDDLFFQATDDPGEEVPIDPKSAFFPCMDQLRADDGAVAWAGLKIKDIAWRTFTKWWLLHGNATRYPDVDLRNNHLSNVFTRDPKRIGHWLQSMLAGSVTIDTRDSPNDTIPSTSLSALEFILNSGGAKVRYRVKAPDYSCSIRVTEDTMDFTNAHLDVSEMRQLAYLLEREFPDLGFTLNLTGNCEVCPAGFWTAPGGGSHGPFWYLEDSGWTVQAHRGETGELPPMPKPKRDANKPTPTRALAEQLVTPIVDLLHPTTITLFGSVPQKKAKRGSDLDLMVLVPSLADAARWQQTRALRYALADFPVKVDATVFDQDSLDCYLESDNPMRRGLTAATVLLYQAPPPTP